MKEEAEEGVDFLIAPNPENDQDWCVIFKGNGYDRLVGRYSDIEITEQGSKLSFLFHPMFEPEEIGDLNTLEFREWSGKVLNKIVVDHHEKESMVYYSKTTGERVEV